MAKEGVLVQKGEIKELQTELGELKSMVTDLKRENADLSNLLKDILRGIKESEVKTAIKAPAVPGPTEEQKEEAQLPPDKISMLPSVRTKAFDLISRLAKEYMDGELTTASLTLYEKRVFSLLVKRYEFVEPVRKEGRSVVYKFREPALEAICKELGGSASVSVRSRMRTKTLEEFLEKMKGRYPHFTFVSVKSGSGYGQFRLLFSDASVKKSVVENLTRTFGPSSVKAS